MRPSRSDFHPDDLARHASEHLVNCLKLAMRKCGVGEWVEDGGFSRLHTGLPNPFGNYVAGASFTEADAPQKIADACAPFLANPVPSWWLAGPESTPANLGDLLVANGVSHIGAMPCMVVDIDDFTPDPLPAGMSIERVETDAQLEEWLQILATGYGLPYAIADLFRNFTIETYTNPNSPAEAHLARIDGQPAACVCTCDYEGTTGIYSVATLSEFRNRGLGRAITSAGMAAGKRRGSRMAVLQSSVMGRSVYEKLGFEEVSTIGIYLIVDPSVVE